MDFVQSLIAKTSLGKFAVVRMLCGFLSIVCLGEDLASTNHLHVPAHFSVTIVAAIKQPRELAFTPNGDLLVGTNRDDVMIVQDADKTPHSPQRFVHLDDQQAAGLALGKDALYIGTNYGVWRVPYHAGDKSAAGKPERLAKLRVKGGLGNHRTTSLALAQDRLLVSIGSSCDACDPEVDETRATVQEMKLDGSEMHARAVRIRNAVAMATNPETGAVWAIPNGQDALEPGHPYEFADPITAHSGVANYGWPHCYENRRKVEPEADCANVIVPRVIFPAYNAPIGAAIYPLHQKGKYAFPAEYGGGLFVGMHGSWHRPLVPPRVAFVPLKGDTPTIAADWSDPRKQWRDFLSGFQIADGSRLGRPTGIAIGPEGSLFIADDGANVIYRIRYIQP